MKFLWEIGLVNFSYYVAAGFEHLNHLIFNWDNNGDFIHSDI